VSEVPAAHLTLGDFREEHAATILGWVQSAEDALGWAETPFLRIGPPVLEQWHAEPGVVPCVGWIGDRLCAYGQVLEDHAEREAEVTRVIVAPELRGQGVGRTFARLLGTEAVRRGFGVVLARTVRANRAAFACYRAAGFSRLSLADEAALNFDQSEDYVWLEFAPATDA
jgi:ribosomal protein S18 acetylase RimI-like enzyme